MFKIKHFGPCTGYITIQFQSKHVLTLLGFLVLHVSFSRYMPCYGGLNDSARKSASFGGTRPQEMGVASGKREVKPNGDSSDASVVAIV